MSTMKIHIDAMSDTFRRHRRNLMATSLLLCFMKYSGLVIRRITPMGTEIILDDEKAVFVMLWLLWFYFVVMYYQHFRQEAVAKLSRSWLRTVNERCKGRALQKLLRRGGRTAPLPPIESACTPRASRSLRTSASDCGGRSPPDRGD